MVKRKSKLKMEPARVGKIRLRMTVREKLAEGLRELGYEDVEDGDIKTGDSSGNGLRWEVSAHSIDFPPGLIHRIVCRDTISECVKNGFTLNRVQGGLIIHAMAVMPVMPT